MRFIRSCKELLGFIGASTLAGGALGGLVGAANVGLSRVFSPKPNQKEEASEDTSSLGEAVIRGTKIGCTAGFVASTLPVSIPVLFMYVKRSDPEVLGNIRAEQAKIASEAPPPLSFSEINKKAQEIRAQQAEIAQKKEGPVEKSGPPKP